MAQRRKVANKEITGNMSEYTCTRCGKTWKPESNKFYKSTYSEQYKYNDKYITVCKDCLNELFEQWARKYKDERIAAIICCHYLDMPFYHSLYESIQRNNDTFKIGLYVRQINGTQYRSKTFCTTLADGELTRLTEDLQKEREVRWTKEELKNRDIAIEIVGYDPFEGYDELDRRFLFNELIKYFDDDIVNDSYKLSQIIQIVNNNNQIRRYDTLISSIDPTRGPDEIKSLNQMKRDLVTSNDKIAKENEISVKNRSNKEVGRSTLSYMMKDLREKGFKDAEANYYDQLHSENTAWAAGISYRSLKENCFFDENDCNEILDNQYNMIQDLQNKLDDAKEEKRLTQIRNKELEKTLVDYGIKIPKEEILKKESRDEGVTETEAGKPEAVSDE